jgi:hypothetical protein
LTLIANNSLASNKRAAPKDRADKACKAGNKRLVHLLGATNRLLAHLHQPISRRLVHPQSSLNKTRRAALQSQDSSSNNNSSNNKPRQTHQLQLLPRLRLVQENKANNSSSSSSKPKDKQLKAKLRIKIFLLAWKTS